MDVGTIGGIATALSMIAFAITAAWAFSARRREQFDRLQKLPLEEDAAP